MQKLPAEIWKKAAKNVASNVVELYTTTKVYFFVIFLLSFFLFFFLICNMALFLVTAEV